MKQVSMRLPGDLRDWLEDAVNAAGSSQQQYLLGLLKAAQEGTLEPMLFDEITTASQPHPPSGLRFRFIDLFAGIGGFRIGLTRAGGQCVFTSEYDKYCQQTYRAWFGEEEDAPLRGDINDVDIVNEIPPHDVLAAGFPCQPFSIAGVSKKNALGHKHGFDCDRQGNLFFRICDIVRAKRPPILLLENVKNLRSHDKGRTWKVIHTTLQDELEYEVYPDVIDAQAWVPQHRERIFIVCFDRHLFGKRPPFSFPSPPDAPAPRLGDILEPDPDPKYVLTEHLWNYLQNYAKKHKAKGNGFGFGLVGPNDVTRTMSARYYKDGSEILIDDPKFPRPRRLTHREAARLLGYTDEVAKSFGHPNGFPVVVSDMQAYKQFGNSVVPAVVEAIGHEIVKTMAWLFETRNAGCLIKGAVRPRRSQKRADQPEPVAV